MRFSWTGLMLAPLLAPLIFSATVIVLVFGGWLEGSLGESLSDSLQAFLTMLVLSCIVSYGSTIFVFLPCLFLLSLERQMTGFKVCLLGLVLGAMEFILLTLILWGSHDPDFPRRLSFFVFFRLWAAHNPITALFPIGGLITAGLYWWLGRRRTSG